MNQWFLKIILKDFSIDLNIFKAAQLIISISIRFNFVRQFILPGRWKRLQFLSRILMITASVDIIYRNLVFTKFEYMRLNLNSVGLEPLYKIHKWRVSRQIYLELEKMLLKLIENDIRRTFCQSIYLSYT